VSYALSAGLQAGIYRRLTTDPAVADLVGRAVYDAPPERTAGETAPDYLTLGEETVRANDTKTSVGALHDFTVTVHSARDGFERAKTIAAAVCACLVDAPLVLDGGRLVALRFLRAAAERGRAPEKRRVSLRFRAVVDED
jgi:Protein of unknown function (DUF3168)